ncbi:hypothetical protein PVL29_007660 [Vitis rotundifolia]|uniref:Uncharacterized protein n=1 Tax=Vitis rotundifolia TaxID=103349 RepID=A0AA39A0V9_VITRO|nr:hypothetical protein PVL29_007660 [Vitis rotundifolia]
MGFGNRLWWCVFFASFLICTARNTLIFPVDEEAAGRRGEEAEGGEHGRLQRSVGEQRA